MKRSELNEVLRLHQLWLDGSPEGDKAYLKGANLIGADLEGVNLKGANLEGVNLSKAYLPYANLKGANLEGANLVKTNLYKATLEGANLKGANLFNTIGNNQEIRTIRTGYYTVNVTRGVVQVGCKAFSWDEWLAFSDQEILNLDGKRALEFWHKYRKYIQYEIDLAGF